MSLFSPRSTLGLLGHELRLTWRGRTGAGGKARRRGLWALVFIMAMLCIPGFLIALKVKPVHIGYVPEIALGVDIGVIFLVTLMLSQTLAAATQVFFERGDLDLLLASPVPARRVLTVRCLGMAFNACILFLLLATPFILPQGLVGHWRWLMAYPLLLSLALLATAVGLAIAMSLFRLIGPRRTKTLAQVMAAIIGAGFFLIAQARNMLPRKDFDNAVDQFSHYARSGPFDQGQPLAWPAQAVMGDAVVTGVLFGASLLIYLFVVRALGGRFAQDAAAAAGVGVSRRKAGSSKVRGFDKGPFGAMLDKELRLIWRDVALLSQVLLRVLYLIPMAAILVNKAGMHSSFLIPGAAAGLVFIAGQLTGSLAWITVSAEDATELLASAPAKTGTLRRAKLTAALIPVAFLLAVPLGILTWFDPWKGAVTTLGCVAVCISDGLIAIWFERPGKRSEFRRRRSGSLVGALAETGVGFLWAGATWLAASGEQFAAWAGGPAVLALLIMIIIRKPERSFSDTLQAA